MNVSNLLSMYYKNEKFCLWNVPFVSSEVCQGRYVAYIEGLLLRGRRGRTAGASGTLRVAAGAGRPAEVLVPGEGINPGP